MRTARAAVAQRCPGLALRTSLVSFLHNAAGLQELLDESEGALDLYQQQLAALAGPSGPAAFFHTASSNMRISELGATAAGGSVVGMSTPRALEPRPVRPAPLRCHMRSCACLLAGCGAPPLPHLLSPLQVKGVALFLI